MATNIYLVVSVGFKEEPLDKYPRERQLRFPWAVPGEIFVDKSDLAGRTT